MKDIKGRGKRFFFFTSILLPLTSILLCSCGPKVTYPSGTVSAAVEKMLLEEDRLKVEATVEGKTLGAVLYLDELVDPKGQVPKEVHDKMGQVMQALTRVALSTDRELDFCVAVIRDAKQGNELIVTRSVDDTKRANADNIGIEESINRTVFSQGQTQLSLPRLEFKLKEVLLENFLADQIAQRIRFNLAKESREAAENPLVLADGSYVVTPEGSKHFYFSMIGFKSKEPHANILGMFRIVNEVFSGYRFTQYDGVELRDYLNRQKLVVDRSVFSDFQAKKINEEEIIRRYLVESQSVQEAFKLFGFNLPAGHEKDAVA